jgi:hypothetical protein
VSEQRWCKIKMQYCGHCLMTCKAKSIMQSVNKKMCPCGKMPAIECPNEGESGCSYEPQTETTKQDSVVINLLGKK